MSQSESVHAHCFTLKGHKCIIMCIYIYTIIYIYNYLYIYIYTYHIQGGAP